MDKAKLEARQAELQTELQRAQEAITEAQAMAYRIQGALILIGEQLAALETPPETKAKA